MKKLHTVNEGLKKFAHVNKKAFEQYNNFTKQRDQLLQRREDLEKSAQSIEELVEVLDQRKDEAIERTFKQVASNFEEVFEKLVPVGRGRLIIQRRIDQVRTIRKMIQSDSDSLNRTKKMRKKWTRHNKVVSTTTLESPSKSACSVQIEPSYTHVFLQVSFNSKVDEGLRIQQLSGGQKSLVALATGTYSSLHV